MSQYEIPSYGTPADRLLPWLLEAKAEGDAWLASQAQSRGWETAMQFLNGPDGGGAAGDLSTVNFPKTKRIFRELVASLANFKHAGEFKVLWDNALYDTAHLLTQLDRNWYRTCGASIAHREGLQYATGLGTAYWLEEWDPTFWGPNRGDVRLSAINPGNVTFVQLPSNRDIQGAYMVIIRRSVPLNLARREWMSKNPGFAMSLVPDRDAPSQGWIQKGLQRVQQFLSPALRVAGRTGQNQQASFPEVDIYTAYTLDSSVNEGIEAVKMGAYGTNWEYEVPAIGDPVGQGLINPRTGQEFTLPAKRGDCLLFPLRRMTIFSSTGVGYDGSSPWWHGEVPLARVWFNDLPWNAIGGSAVSDAESMETGIVALMRNIEDSAAARLDPAMLYDENLTSRSFAEGVNPRKAGVRAQANLAAGDVMKPILPPQYYDVPQWITTWIEAQEGRMDYVTGVRDLVAMAKTKQIPGADTLGKLMEMAGPLVEDMVGAMIAPLTQLGEWRKAYFLQFYGEARIIETVGPDDGAEQISTTEFISDKLREKLYRADGSARSSFQFLPEMLATGLEGLSAPQRKQKLKRLLSEFYYEVTESGLTQISRMETLLLYLQLRKEGVPISSWTMAKVAKISNYGPPPAGTNTEYERWVAEQRINMELAQVMQEEAAVAGVPPGAPTNGSGHVGRPNSYSKPPKLQVKDGGARTTVTTS